MTTPSHPTRRLRFRSWFAVVPTLIILALVLLLTETTSAAPAAQPAQAPAAKLSFQQSQPACQSCHAEEYKVWQGSTHANATLDPIFQEQLAKGHDQAECLKCHTTGFDSGSGKFMSEGVTCEACHGQYKEGHPAAATMQLPMQSDTCKLCHQAVFKDWETSQHAAQQIDCFDCHQAHSQGVRTGDANTLCSACHTDQQTTLAHSIHGISGVDCVSCHMMKETTTTDAASGVHIEASSHSFTVPADVCNRCHSSATHPTGSQQQTAGQKAQSPQTGMSEAKQLQQANAQIKDLQDEVTALDQRLTSMRSISVVGMGLMLAVGGFFGLVLGIAGMSFWRSARKAK